MEGLHGKKINLVAPHDKECYINKNNSSEFSLATGGQVHMGSKLSSANSSSIIEPKSYSLQVPPMKIVNNDRSAYHTRPNDGTLNKNDSLHSKGLFQVTEKNSENQSMMGPPSQLQNHPHVATATLKDYQSHKSLSKPTSEGRSSALFAELSRLEKELKEKGAQPILARETTLDRQRRNKLQQ